jgi:hypothetical protein
LHIKREAEKSSIITWFHAVENWDMSMSCVKKSIDATALQEEQTTQPTDIATP